MRFEIVTVVSVMIAVFCGVALFTVVDKYVCLEEPAASILRI
jgi:hypothetical protein